MLFTINVVIKLLSSVNIQCYDIFKFDEFNITLVVSNVYLRIISQVSYILMLTLDKSLLNTVYIEVFVKNRLDVFHCYVVHVLLISV